jgi:hypothetical protein
MLLQERGVPRKLCALGVASIIAVASVHPIPAQANIVGDAWGIATDPFKLAKASDNILEAINRINDTINSVRSVEGKTNADVKDRLDQVQGIVDAVVSGARTDIREATQEVEALEAKIYADLMDVLQQVECVAEDVAVEELPQAIANALNLVNEANIHIDIFGIKVINLQSNQIQITDPDAAYVTTRNAYLAYIRTLGPDAPAYTIVSKLGNIARVAQLTRCVYRGNPLDEPLYREERQYSALSNAWTSTLRVAVQLAR